MSSPRTIDFNELLEPVSSDNPVGKDLREDSSPSSLYYQIKRQRADARERERSELEEDEQSQPVDAWRQLATAASEAIAHESKDLEVAAWLAEAMVRLKGFAGLRDSFRLTRRLVEFFWDDLYPLPRDEDEDALETRRAPLSGLNGEGAEGTLIAPIRKIPLTQPGSSGAFAQWQYKNAVRMQGRPNAANQKQSSDLLAAMEKTAAETELTFFSNLRDDLGECEDEFAQLCRVLDEKCGPKAPPSSSIKNALEDCKGALRFFIGNRLPEEEVADAAEDSEQEDEGGRATEVAARNVGESETLKSREQAFAALMQLATYFRRTEPHSPVSYLLEQAVRWGRMPLPALWEELISDEKARSALFKITGVRPPAE